ncbi:MAG: T9SS type A sorting domain-containing protein [Saprospiraceae bacterium]|nr:T9SS type A sorting domain-containing protein [Saprospiraceae bacterium]
MRFLPFLLLLPFCSFAQNYMMVESVEYDPGQNRWLAGNQTSILARAADGTLTYFGSGSATHGLEIMGNTLFAIDNNTLRGFDLDTEAQVMTLSIPGVAFLNGITNDGNGTLYVTDFSAKKIYKVDVSDLNNPSWEIIVNNTVSTPNGILYVEDPIGRLLFVNWGSSSAIKAVDLSDYSVSTIVNTGLTNVDGIDDDAAGNIYISSWSPAQITKYDPNFMNAPEIVSTPFISSPADIGYAQQTDTLAIPVGPNVVFVGLELPSNTIEPVSPYYEMQVYPNPVTPASVLHFSLPSSTTVQLEIRDIQGRFIQTVLSGTQSVGHHKISLAGLELPQGTYFFVLSTPITKEVTRFVVIR